MRIPPSNMGWQSTAVIKWAIFCQVSRCKENSWQFSVAKYTFLVWRYLNISLNIFLSLQESFTWKVSEPNFSMIFALPCIRDYHSPCTRVQYGRWIRVGIWFMNREQESTDPCLINPEGWTFQSCDCSRWSQPASAAPRRRARTARRCTGLAAEVVSPDYQTSGGINSLKFIYWQGSLAASHQTSKKGGWGPSPGQERETNPRSTW